MDGFQFISVNSYSSARPHARNRRGKITGSTARKWSASDVLDEAARELKACKHVSKPMEPMWFVGCRAEIEQAGQAWKAVTRYGSRAVRSDSPWLAAGIVSLPRSRISEWPKFRDDSITYLKKKYGGRLIGVCEHLDEPHPHLHFYGVPRPGENFGVVHEGFAAKTNARRSGLQKIGTAFVNAMKQLQDEFHAQVGQFWGLARLGPGKSRKTRSEWQTAHAESVAATAALKLQNIELAGKRFIENVNENAATVIGKAKIQAAESVKVETQRIRKKGAEYFLKNRAALHEERRQLIEAQHQLSRDKAENEAQAAALQAASDSFRSSQRYHLLDDMRADITRAESALKKHNLIEAAEALFSARKADYAPTLNGPKVSR